jgi:hypothetical protein
MIDSDSPGFVSLGSMTNRTESDYPAFPQRSDPLRRLEQARADLSRGSRGAEPPEAEPSAVPVPSAAPVDPAAVAARIDLMRARFGKSRYDIVSALLFLGDAQQDCNALSDACAANRWVLMASGVALLSDSLRRALPSEPRHLDLVGLLIDALYALRRAETRPDMGRAGADLLRGLKLAANRELPDTVA